MIGSMTNGIRNSRKKQNGGKRGRKSWRIHNAHGGEAKQYAKKRAYLWGKLEKEKAHLRKKNAEGTNGKKVHGEESPVKGAQGRGEGRGGGDPA